MEFNATFITSAISFIVFAIIMNAIFYKPLAKIVEERQKFVDETNKEAEQNSKKAEAILSDKTKKIEQTKQEAKKIISSKSEVAKAQKAAAAAEAQQKSVSEINIAKEDLTKAQSEVDSSLADEAGKLADVISERILGKV